MSPSTSSRVCVAQFGAAHGVRGLLRVKSFTADPAALGAYGPVEDERGRTYRLEIKGVQDKGMLLCAVDGVADRDQAAALTGTRLYVDRSAMPEPDDEEDFYHADLIGCDAVRPDGEAVGRVKAVLDFGAGELLEIVSAGKPTAMVPFTKGFVPVVDVAQRRIVVDYTEIEPDKDEEGAA